MKYIEDTPRYKKKSQAKPPKKSKHKHVYEPCVIEYPRDWYKKEHERSVEKRVQISSYCPICGKVGDIDHDRWWRRETLHGGSAGRNVPTDEALREYNPETRTLPTFVSDEYFAKFVELPEVQE